MTPQQRKEFQQRGQTLFEASNELALLLRFVGIGLMVLGAIGICAGVIRSAELSALGLLAGVAGFVLMMTAKYFVSLAAVSAALLDLQLVQSPDDDVTGGAADPPPAPTPLTTPRKPPQELPPIPLAGDEEKPS